MNPSRHAADLFAPDPSAASNPDAATWPILARLPLVGGSSASDNPSKLGDAGPDANEPFAAVEAEPGTVAWLDQRRDASASRDAARSRALDVLNASPERRRRTFIDPAHGALRPPALVELPPLVAQDAPEGFELPPSRRQSRRLRADHSAGRSLTRFDAQRMASSKSLAERAYLIHATMAPHAALVVMTVLVLSGGILYWIAFGGRSEADKGHNAIDLPGEALIETTGSAPSPAAAPTTLQVAGAPERGAPALEQMPEGREAVAVSPPGANLPTSNSNQPDPNASPLVRDEPPAVNATTTTTLRPGAAAREYPATSYRAFDFPLETAAAPAATAAN